MGLTRPFAIAAVIAVASAVPAISVESSSPKRDWAPRICETARNRMELLFLGTDADRLMGYRMSSFAFENGSGTRCRMYGYPTVTVYSGGKALTTGQENGCCYITNSDPPSEVVVHPGGHAYFGVVDFRCDPPHEYVGSSDEVVAAPPDESQARRVSATDIPVCSHRTVGVTEIRSSQKELSANG